MTAITYHGVLPANRVIRGDTLIQQLGLREGVLINSISPWLYFRVGDTVLYVASRPLLHSVSWLELQRANAVSGQRQILINDKSHRLRLLRGEVSATATVSEWETLFFQHHPSTHHIPPLCDLHIGNYSGGFCWALEESRSYLQRALVLGADHENKASVGSLPIQFNREHLGYRPVLESVI